MLNISLSDYLNFINVLRDRYLLSVLRFNSEDVKEDIRLLNNFDFITFNLKAIFLTFF